MSGYKDIVVAVPVSVPYARQSRHGATHFLGRAMRALVEGAGIEKSAIDGLAVASFTMAPDSGVALARTFGLSLRWLDTIPLGGASAIAALRRAARAVEAGDAEIVACIGGDTNQPGGFRQITARLSAATEDALYPVGAGGPNQSFAYLTDAYMRRFGARAEDFGRLCVAQRANAAGNPAAMLRAPITLDDYMASRPIAGPIRKLDCVMPCAGAEGFVVMRRHRADELGVAACALLSSSERHNAFADDQVQYRGGWALDRDALYGDAGVTPPEIDLVQTYDDYPVMSFIQLEDLGFCDKGEAARFVADHDLRSGGDFPVNTGGGQLSAGQAGAGGGFLGVTEALRQLTGRAEGRQVPRARTALVSGFGMIAYDRGLSAGAAILARQ
ncbi:MULTISPECIES: thiolase family protein [unclassified Roseitalea]|uniref:thiolase family protein n=1 Tax=unclassified Roseitalea TaxID=2639107 RepID=UPI00273D8A66|nr:MULTISPECIES: thiolase family protein [unclassified Roseitalea]